MRTTARESRDALQEIVTAHQVVTMMLETPVTSVEALREVMMAPAELTADRTATPSNPTTETTFEAPYLEKIHETFLVVIRHGPQELF